MKAGKELDKLVAKEIFGGVDGALPSFSTYISATWQVFENLTDRGWHVMVRFDPERERSKWTCTVSRKPFTMCARVDATTAELAICRAALEAVMGSAEEDEIDR